MLQAKKSQKRLGDCTDHVSGCNNCIHNGNTIKVQSPVEERKLEKSAGYMLIGTKKPQQCLLSNEKNWLKWIFYHNKKRYEWLYEIEKVHSNDR